MWDSVYMYYYKHVQLLLDKLTVRSECYLQEKKISIFFPFPFFKYQKAFEKTDGGQCFVTGHCFKCAIYGKYYSQGSVVL